MDMTGLVLAGGDSRRMGRDKALIVLQGERLVDRAVSRLRTLCPTVVVAAGARVIADLDVEQIADTHAGHGPLSGILAGLELATTPLVAVIAVDMPHADPHVLAALAEQWRGEHARIPVIDGRAQPLHAVWATSAAPLLRQRLDAGLRSVNDAAKAAGAVYEDGDWPSDFAANINQPEDLQRAAGPPPP